MFQYLKKVTVAQLFNFLGLFVAFSVALLVFIYVKYEYSYDGFHENKERIFQLENQRNDGIWESNFSRPNVELIISSSPHIVAGGLLKGYSKNETSWSSQRDGLTDGVYNSIIWINPGLTEIFHFDMIEGSTEVLSDPNSIIIPYSLARKLFGKESAIGKQLYSELKDFGDKFSISKGVTIQTSPIIGGVYRDFPSNSRLINAVYAPILPDENMDDWYSGAYYCYLLLDSPDSIDGVITSYKKRNAEIMDQLAITDIRLRPLENLYFEPNVRYDSTPVGNKTVTDILLLVSLLIIIIAAINFVNFSIALTSKRIKNINTRKVIGCAVFSLRREIVMESVIFTFIAFLFSLLFVWIIQQINITEQIFGFPIALKDNIELVLLMVAIALITGLGAGIYPAWYMTSFPTAMALNGSYSITDKAKNIKKSLIGFQYVISFALISGAIFIHIQNKYIHQIDIGFDKENILESRLSMLTSVSKTDLYRQKLMEHSNIIDVAFCQDKFGNDESKTSIGYFYKGKHSFQFWLRVSPNFPEVMGMRFRDGRTFREGDAENPNKAYCIVSSLVADRMGCTPGSELMDDGRGVEIVGVFENVHFESLLKPIAPLGLWVCAPQNNYRNNPFFYSYIKIGNGNIQATMDHIKKVMKEIDPGYPVRVSFFDERLNELYEQTHKQGLMVTYFCIIAVLISIMGVFGLVVFETQSRRKEIAIRKALGSDTRNILLMFNAEFLKIALISFIISVPLSWSGISLWLNNFSFKTPIHFWVFIIAFIILCVLTILTVTFQSYQSAHENPAGILK